MQSRTTFRPELVDSRLEQRVLMAYDPSLPPAVLTTGGYYVLSAPPMLSSSLGTLGGSFGGSGGAMATSYYVTGFGLSSISIGNSIGVPALNVAGKSASAGNSVSVAINVGSGANDSSSPNNSVSRATVAQGDNLSGFAPGYLYIGKPFGGSAGTPLEATNRGQPPAPANSSGTPTPEPPQNRPMPPINSPSPSSPPIPNQPAPMTLSPPPRAESDPPTERVADSPPLDWPLFDPWGGIAFLAALATFGGDPTG